MNFSIFCSDFSLQSSRGLDVVEIAGFRRNSSNLGTLWGIKEGSSEQNNNSWKYLSFFQINLWRLQELLAELNAACPI